MATPIVTSKYIEAASFKWYNFVETKTERKLVAIYSQETLQYISLFTSQPKSKFYDTLFLHLDFSCM